MCNEELKESKLPYKQPRIKTYITITYNFIFALMCIGSFQNLNLELEQPSCNFYLCPDGQTFFSKPELGVGAGVGAASSIARQRSTNVPSIFV